MNIFKTNEYFIDISNKVANSGLFTLLGITKSSIVSSQAVKVRNILSMQSLFGKSQHFYRNINRIVFVYFIGFRKIKGDLRGSLALDPHLFHFS